MNAALRVAAVLAVLVLVACTVRHPAATLPAGGTAGGPRLTPAQLLAAVQGDAEQIDQGQDATARARLLGAATGSAQQCLAQAPDSAACQYAQAQVLGLSAREHPLQAPSLLKDMLASLAKAEGRDPLLDHAGPARLSAVVLLRAPPWPLGPGDVDTAVLAAQRAVQRDPAWPPNLIILGQAQARSGATEQARATFAKAQLAVKAAADPSGGAPAGTAAERAQWQQAVEQGLNGPP